MAEKSGAVGSVGKVGIAVLLALGSLTLAPPASASPDGKSDPSGSTPIDAYSAEVGNDFLDNQQKLQDFKAWIITQSGWEEYGYIDQVNDANSLSTRLLWSGTSPFLDRVSAEALGRGINLTVEQRPQPLPAIKATAEKIAAAKSLLRTAGFDVQVISGVRADSAEIVVQGYIDPLKTVDLGKIRELASSIAGSQVGVEKVDKVLPATRSNDTEPFNSGAYMRNTSNGRVCSTGFALWMNSRSYTTTAQHCNDTPYTARDNSYTWIGGTSNYEGGAQSRVLVTGGSKWMYDGAWDNAAGYSKAVQQFADLSLDDWVCTSGGNSGVHCGIQVTSMYNLWWDGISEAYNIGAYQRNVGQYAAIQGDSGGPVLVPYANGNVGAAGMIQAVPGGDTNGCAPAHDLGANKCSPTVFFTSMRSIANNYGASLVTW